MHGDIAVSISMLKDILGSTVKSVKSYVGAGLDARCGALEARIYALEKKGAALRYCGAYDAGNAYAEGNFVTHDGSIWHANAATTSRPGTDATWTLAVKHGRDLR